jgi:N-carbamoylputrescine amidase
MSAVTVGLIQMRCSADPAENLARALTQIDAAARRGAQIVCLPELFRSRYFCQTEDPTRFELAEPIPGPSTEALARVAASREIALVAPLFERRAEGVYHNTAVILDEGGAEAGRYRKMHIPDDSLYLEKFYFTPGDLGFQSVATRAVRLGVLICWDQWFPEAARLTALAGAQILFYPTAIGWQLDEGPEVEAAQLDAWETVQRAHAIANGVFVAAVNRVGHEPPMGSSGSAGAASGGKSGIRFWGRSFVADPFGRVLARASDREEELLVVECDLSAVARARQDWPFLRDRRIDAYADLVRRLRD